MNYEFGQKITTEHLKRNAYLYIRQSTLRQVFENTESTKRQYALKDRAIAMGWPVEQVVIIDSDLGQSGASTDREGFKKLVSEVGLGQAGIVIGLEVSRLARNSVDWHRLVEICALTRTLILDEDGIYDPSHFNDRLLLGLKGTMSEAELHVLRARLLGGMYAKARRGELKTPVPIGFIYNVSNKVVFDPDKQVQKSIHLFFEVFRQTGSAMATVKYFRKRGLKFPCRIRKGPNKGDLLWMDLVHSRALQTLHNPKYAGAFFYGRHKVLKSIEGKQRIKKLPIDQWHTLLRNNHKGYISWEDYELNTKTLKENAQANGSDRKKSPAREGPALLQGIVACGVCGKRMTIRYRTTGGQLVPEYVCQRKGIENGNKICQTIKGAEIDAAVSKLLIESVTPMALEVALKVQDELTSRWKGSDLLRKQHVERMRYGSNLARRRYMQVDPDNRLVADSLEAEWNNKLRELNKAQEEYEQQSKRERRVFSEEEKANIISIAKDFPRLWNDPQTPNREKKRMIRLLIEDVTLIKNTGIIAHVRFKGGAVKTLTLEAAKSAWELRQTSPEVVSRIDKLLEKITEGKIARVLNKEGKLSGCGQQFNANIVAHIRRSYKLKSRYMRLKEQGLLTLKELSEKINIHHCTIKYWNKKNILISYPYNNKNERLYELPGKELIDKLRKESLVGRGEEFVELLSNRLKEVQYAA